MSDANHKNIMAIKHHSEETRVMFRELEKKFGTIDTLIERLNQLENQVKNLQIKLYSGGATD